MLLVERSLLVRCATLRTPARFAPCRRFLWHFLQGRVLVERFEVVLHPRFFPL